MSSISQRWKRARRQQDLGARFTGDITLAKGVISVQTADARRRQRDRGQGTYNLDTYEYSINADGKNIDLARVSNAADIAKLAEKRT